MKKDWPSSRTEAEAERFVVEAVASLAGLAPVARASGLMRGRRTIWGGRKPVRAALYMATLVATRHNPTIRAFYEGLRTDGKATRSSRHHRLHAQAPGDPHAMLTSESPWRMAHSA